MYDASDPQSHWNNSISIPGIDHLLIIGNTPDVLDFSGKITKISNINNVYHSKDVEGALDLLKSIKVSIIIIDGDSDIDPVSCSRLIVIQNAISRIIMISTNIESREFMKLKNNGIIHAFIGLPSDLMIAHTILVQEQAKYHINQTLKLLLTDPPKGTPLYRKLKFPSWRNTQRQDLKYTLLAISIVHDTLSKYNYVLEDEFEVDPVLFSSYFSAVSILSEKIMEKTGKIESFEFNNQVVLVKLIDGVRYIFVVNGVTESNRKNVELLVNTISQKLYLALGDEIKGNEIIADDEEIEALIRDNLPAHQREILYEAEKKAQIVNIHEPNSNLSQFYDETSRAYEIHYVDAEEQLFDMINDSNFEIVLFNNFEQNFKWNKYLLNIVKDESPFTQSVAIIDDTSEINLSSILNVNDLDFVIDIRSELDDYYFLFKKAVEKSRSIQDGILMSDLTKIYRMKSRPELLKAMIRRQDVEFDQTTVPKFNSLLIMIGSNKLYSYYNSEIKSTIAENEELFLGFIDSLLTFTDEIRHSPIMFSGINYGSSNIILKQIKGYHFIYFIDKLDQTNYDVVSDVLSNISTEIFGVVKYDQDPNILSDGMSQLLDEICITIDSNFEDTISE